MVIFNIGARANPEARLENARAVMARVVIDLSLSLQDTRRAANYDDPAMGFYGFALFVGELVFIIQIPGDDPEEVVASLPLRSRRLYVDGSSWFYGFAINLIQGKLFEAAERKATNG